MYRLFLTRLILTLLAALPGLRAESIVFPKDAGVIDVTKSPYFAKGDGRTDDTEAIQQALMDNPSTNRIIYLPDGVYILSGPLRWPGSEDPELNQRATILQGQSRNGTILRLTDYAPGFSNSGRAKALLWTGVSQSKHYRNAVRHLTIHTGQGNPGVIAIEFLAKKQGCVRDVTLIADTPGSSIGLDLSQAETQGPLLIQHLRVVGFDIGISMANAVHSVTLEDIELVGQGVAGIRNRGQVVNIRGLRSTNSVPTIQNSDPTGFVTIMEGVFQGLPSKHPQPAMLNKGILFARQLKTPGYTNAVENRTGHGDGVAGLEVREFVSHSVINIHPAPQYSLYLPIKETPDVPWDPLSKWASPLQHGAVVNDRRDSSAAIRAAIDSGAPTLYFPNGSWTIRKTVDIRSNVRRIIGCEARIICEVPGSAPVVRFERLEIDPPQQAFLEQTSPGTLVMADLYGANLQWNAKGSVFLEDVSTELLGGLCFANGTYKLDPMFRINNASATLSVGETSLNGTPYSTIVTETRNGLTRFLGGQGVSQDLPLPTRIGGVSVPLFTGYHGIGDVAPKSGIPMNKTPATPASI